MGTNDSGQAVQSGDLLDAVLMANNKWRLEMWCLRLHKDTAPEVAKLVAIIMDRQLELEEQAKASNAAGEVRRNAVTSTGLLADESKGETR